MSEKLDVAFLNVLSIFDDYHKSLSIEIVWSEQSNQGQHCLSFHLHQQYWVHYCIVKANYSICKTITIFNP